jgi:signal peptidase I
MIEQTTQLQPALTTETTPRPTLKQRGFLREAIETVVMIAAIFALVNLASVRFFIDGPSMQPTFHDGEFLVVSRVHYLFGEPSRGDIVVFHSPRYRPDDPPLIKRLVGMPLDTIEIRDTRVYVNGTMIEEPYINEACTTNMCPNEAWTLGANEYFLMGDNRNHSNDSRAFGPVSRDLIVGEALFRYWPLSKFGSVWKIRLNG